MENPEKRRLYGTIDMFPTTLASLGVKIEDNRLGLGSNLFSDEETLTEKYDVETVNTELGNKSEFLVSKNKYEFTDPLTFTIQVKNGEGSTYSLQGPTIDPSQYLNN